MANTTLIWGEVNQIIVEKKKFDNKKSYLNLNFDQFKNKLKKKFSNLSTNFPTIFEKTINGTMDMNRLKFMLNMINKVNNNEIGVFPIDEECWIDVGQWAEYQKAVEKL